MLRGQRLENAAFCDLPAFALLDHRRKFPAQRCQPDELVVDLREMLLGHYTGWLDTELPILGNRTPRQAVRDADGREAVEALIAQMERDAQKKTPPLDPGITQMLRRELGLAEDAIAREGSGV